MARDTFTTYLNSIMDAGVERSFQQLDRAADATFSSIARGADQALSGVDKRIERFRNSFQDVSRTIQGLSNVAVGSGRIDLNVGELRTAAAQAKLYEQGLLDTLRAATLMQKETNDGTRATRDYIAALQASYDASKQVTRQADEQVQFHSRLQDATDKTAARTSALTQAYRELHAEEAAAARRDVVAQGTQGAFNNVFARGVSNRAVDNGAGFSALAEKLDQEEQAAKDLKEEIRLLAKEVEREAEEAVRSQERVTLAIERRMQEAVEAQRIAQITASGYERIAAGGAALDRSAVAGASLESVLRRVGAGAKVAAQGIDEAVEANRRLATAAVAQRNSATGYERLASGNGAIDAAALAGTRLEDVLRRVNVQSREVGDAIAAQAKRAATALAEEARAAEDAAEAQKKLNAEVNRIRASLDPAEAALQRYQAQLQSYDRILGQQPALEAEVSKWRQRAAQDFDVATREAREASEAAKGYGNSLRGQRTAYIQSGQQLQDIAISFAGGQRASTIFAQQLPQLAYALQDVGGRAGKVATFFAGPWGLALVAGSFLLGGLIDKLFDTGDASDKARASNIDFTNSLEVSRGFVLDYATAIDALSSATRGLINTQAILTDSLATTARTQVDDLQAKLGTIDSQIAKLNQSGFQGVTGRLLGTNSNSAQVAALREQRAKVVADLESANTSFARAQTALDERRAQEDADSDVKARNEIAREKARLLRQREQTREQGAVPLAGFSPISESDFNSQYVALEKREKALADAIKERGKAATRAKSEAAAAARQAEQEAEAASKRRAGEARDEAELALLRRRPTLTDDQFNEEMRLIAKRYDEEMLRIDALSTRRSTANALEKRQLTELYESGKRNGEAVRNIVNGYIDAETPLKKLEKDLRAIDKLIGKPVTSSGYILTKADGDDLKSILYDGLQRPYEEFLRTAEQGSRLAELEAAGYGLVADALEVALDLRRQGAKIGEDEFQNILATQRAQADLNDRLETAREIQSATLGLAQQTRQATEDAIIGLAQGQGLRALKNFGRQVLDNVIAVEAKRITATLFAGTDSKLRGLLDDTDGVRQAIKILESNVTDNSAALDTLEAVLGQASNAVTNFANTVNNSAAAVATGGGSDVAGLGKQIGQGVVDAAATRAATVAPSGSGGFSAGSSLNYIMSAPDLPAGVAPGSDEALSIVSRTMMRPLEKIADSTSDLGNLVNADPDGVQANIEVFARKQADAFDKRYGKGPSTGEVVGTSFEKLGTKLDGLLGTNFIGGVGKAVGKGFQGAAEGQIASGFARALGIKQSSTGAAVGGAIGSFLPIPGGSIIGGLVGGTLGGLLKKTTYGTASVGQNQFGELTSSLLSGRGTASKAAATGAAGGVAGLLTQLQEGLDFDIEQLANVSIGTYKDKFRVSTTGRTGKLKGKYADVVDFGKDGEEEAVQFAVQTLLEKSVITGISQASINILKSGQDLQKAVEKANVIESIPKRLLALTNPVRYAVEELNDEFEDMISYLKEGGATAEQFADAQKLYDLERAAAIEQATNASVDALEDFLKNMKGGSDSPLSRRSVYSNAESEFAALQAKIAKGEAVDQDDLLQAAQNFQAASQTLLGSGSGFFADFNRIFDVVNQAKNNIEGTTSGSSSDLPASPFQADTSVATAIAATSSTQVAAINNQTAQISADLQNVLAAIQGTYGVTPNSSALALLRNFR